MLDQIQQMSKIVNDSAIVFNNRTGQGTFNDPSTHTVIVPGQPIPDVVQQALFAGSDLGRKMCSKLAEDALKKGVYVELPDKESAAHVSMAFDDLNAVTKFCNAGIFAKNFGGSVCIVGIDDGRAPSEPVDYENIKSIYSLDVTDRRWVYPIEWEQDPYSPGYGEPSVYEVYNITQINTQPSFVHKDRLIIFRGLLTTDDERLKRNSWDMCIYDIILPILNDFNTAYANTSAALQKSTQGIFKIKDLVTKLTTINATDLQRRWDLVDNFRSIYKSIVVDQDGEDFQYVQANLSGYEPILQNYMIRLSAAANMPVTVLMGQSPTGLSATGESDLRIWNSEVQSYQKLILKPKFEYLAKLIMLAKNIEIPKIWNVTFPSPWDQTPSEITARRSAISTIDSANIDKGVFTAEEVALFRSQPGGYDMDISLTPAGKAVRETSLNAFYKSVIFGAEQKPSETENETAVAETTIGPQENKITGGNTQGT